jgi:hypothetical protein
LSPYRANALVKRINRFSHKKEKNKHVNKIERT